MATWVGQVFLCLSCPHELVCQHTSWLVVVKTATLVDVISPISLPAGERRFKVSKPPFSRMSGLARKRVWKQPVLAICNLQLRTIHHNVHSYFKAHTRIIINFHYTFGSFDVQTQWQVATFFTFHLERIDFWVICNSQKFVSVLVDFWRHSSTSSHSNKQNVVT